MHRSTPKLLLTSCFLSLFWLATSAHAWSSDDAIEVSVRVQDESGKPIPYVTAWSAINYDKKRIKDGGMQEYLSIDDLWRVTQRYGALHDIVSQFGDKPVASLWVSVMGSADGNFHESLDDEAAAGKGSHGARPASVTLGYTFMKRGYLPGKVVLTAPRNQHRVEATVTLKRNPDEAPETQPYLQTFDRLRYELSDSRRNAELTEENQLRLASLQDQMEQVAQQALAAGDRSAAARIYSRMRYIPNLYVVDGRIAGSDHGDAGSPQARRAVNKAYELDPDNLYVWMQTYLRRTALLPHPTTEERIEASLAAVEKLIAAKGEAVWPQCMFHQAVGHAMLGRYETAYRLYREAARREPKYMDWDEEIRNLKAEMKSSGVAVPAD